MINKPTEKQRDAAGHMLRELNNRSLTVKLIPAPDKKHSGHSIRTVEQSNPDWYKALCKQYPSNRTKPRQRKDKFTDSLIRRKEVIRALKQIWVGRSFNQNRYTERLHPYIDSVAAWLDQPTDQPPVF